jgi:hypothetical protein
MNRRFVDLVLLCQLLWACGGGAGAGAVDGGGGSADGAGTVDRPADAGPPPAGGMGTVYGMVTDIGTGARIASAAVSGGGQSATTDGQGTFTLAGLAAGDVTLSISAKDYAPGYTSARAGDSAQAVLVTLKKQGTAQTYNAGSAMTLSQKTEAGPYAVVLAPNSLETSDTSLKVAITPLDPTKEREALPGSLVSGGATPSLLVPVTFAEFTILDSAGKRVNLKPSASAQVELPIPPMLRSAYPAGTKIHCYAYDARTGKWEDFVEGTVQTSSVDGTSPVLAAAVRHFSWYGGAPQGNNCVDVYVSVVSAVDGKPLPNARVEATPGTVAYTDAMGSALVRSTAGGPPSTYTAYQTGLDVDGSLTGIKGAKYIEFGRVQEDLVGLVQKPCTGDPMPGPGPAGARGSQAMPLTLKVGVVKNLLYEATAILSAGKAGNPGSISVILQQGVPGPDGTIDNPMPASGARVALAEGNAAPVPLPELAPGTGLYAAASGVTVIAGKAYSLAIDADGNGSIDGSARVFAVGELAWSMPAAGSTVPAANLMASWTDSGAVVGGAGYAPLYQVSISSQAGTDLAFYTGTERQFTVTSALMPGMPLKPGTYTVSAVGFSGFYGASAGGLQLSNNITGAGVTGQFFSISDSQVSVMFTVQ